MLCATSKQMLFSLHRTIQLVHMTEKISQEKQFTYSYRPYVFVKAINKFMLLFFYKDADFIS